MKMMRAVALLISTVSYMGVMSQSQISEEVSERVSEAVSETTPCHVRTVLISEATEVVLYSEADPDRVDHTIHQWCHSNNIVDLDYCNELRNYFLNLCHPGYLLEFQGPIHVIDFKGKMYNIHMKKTDMDLKESVNRFCESHLPRIDPNSIECNSIKSALMDDSFVLPPLSSGVSLLESLYQNSLTTPSDVRDHMEDHSRLAKECEVVLEVGVRGMVSTWGMLWGLVNSGYATKKYIGVDLHYPNGIIWRKFERACEESEVECVFLEQNDITLDLDVIGDVDMLFVDALHTYCHVMYELSAFHRHVKKYITLHDTSAPWGDDDEPFDVDLSIYPDWFQCDTSKKGVYTAVQDFLEMHSTEWTMTLRKENSNGYTLLERVKE
jgi:hypothetical protein